MSLITSATRLLPEKQTHKDNNKPQADSSLRLRTLHFLFGISQTWQQNSRKNDKATVKSLLDLALTKGEDAEANQLFLQTFRASVEGTYEDAVATAAMSIFQNIGLQFVFQAGVPEFQGLIGFGENIEASCEKMRRLYGKDKLHSVQEECAQLSACALGFSNDDRKPFLNPIESYVATLSGLDWLFWKTSDVATLADFVKLRVAAEGYELTLPKDGLPQD